MHIHSFIHSFIVEVSSFYTTHSKTNNVELHIKKRKKKKKKKENCTCMCSEGRWEESILIVHALQWKFMYWEKKNKKTKK